MKLYWVTTDDHHEDWFVIARDLEEAERFHEASEGYETGEAVAEEVLTIPDHYAADVGWSSNDLLKRVGGRFISTEPTRIVVIENRKFCEGLLEGVIRELDDNRFEAHGEGRPNQTERSDSD